MEKFKEEFIKFMISCNALSFGEFTTKSGRKTPFFINTGSYSTGLQLSRLGYFYAETFIRFFPQKIDALYGPAYKGIPLVCATAYALAEKFNRNIAFCFNRKEAKDHGEGGIIVGHNLRDGEKIVIIEDVVTAGTSVRESISIIKSIASVEIVGLLVSVDRMEKGKGEKSALRELCEEFNIEAYSIVTIEEIATYLYNREINGKIFVDEKVFKKIEEYRNLYGAKG
ncbi:MAG: orotate phosphoribosyltransferase [Chitinispirillaceae bacterium]|nr:orotate phosphoribosyltransferase [Chitinispirillaceae bacterium]